VSSDEPLRFDFKEITTMLKKFVLTVSLGAMLASLTTSTLSAHALPDTYSDVSTVAPYSSVTYRPILFSSDDYGAVAIGGDGSTMLDVAVYDERGNLIIHYAGYSPSVSFRPYWVQGMIIKVRNLGGYSNTFSMHTN
jgi:hypothetical protein